MTLAMRGALVAGAIGTAVCAAGETRVRIAGGALILAALAVYVWGWRSRELPLVAQSWPTFVCAARRAWARLPAPSEAPTVVALLSITLIGLGLRLQYLFQPIRYDEAFTLINFAAVPLWVGLSSYYAPNNHLLHTLLVHLAVGAFGPAEWVLRLPALAAGVLVIPMTYVAGRAVYSSAAGLLGAALVAGSAVFVEFSTNARGYTLLSLIVLLLIAMAAHLRRVWTVAGFAIWSVVAALGFFTIPVMLYGWGMVLLWLLLSTPATGLRTRVLDVLRSARWTLLLTLLLYTPVLVRTGLESLVMNRFVEPLTLARFLVDWPPAAASVWRDWMRHMPPEVQVALVGGFVASLVGGLIVQRGVVPLPIAALLWIVPLVIAQRVVPFERVWLFLLPPYFVAAAWGLVFVVRPVLARLPDLVNVTSVGIAAVGLALFLGTRVSVRQPIPARKAELATIFLDGYLRAGDHVVAEVPVDWPLRYYFARRGLSADYLRPDRKPSAGGRTIVAVDASDGQTFGAVIAASGLPSGESSPVWAFDTLSLYEMSGPAQ
ncbi:MAG: hypothetical protein NVSMB2_22910 [Chloroflexota bacterium]